MRRTTVPSHPQTLAGNFSSLPQDDPRWRGPSLKTRFKMAASGVRRLHCGVWARAGSLWRLQQGLDANPSGYGPLTELPDWSFAETSCIAVTGNGCRITGMAPEAAREVTGRRKEAEKCS
ncbi:PREDICTED: 39S ribosomal protein L52, mitochondrial isoform X1 [Dipodomys ordii]|uniref:Large ribosomal subunit protein mL52 n=1 Tax=Dipodomys ordii TaxID=10020 RepID=A0A1S3FWY1_DIPOR|nr:PREDICTED: 39S ribosomal protein L52, mitochondrial isoform X1 [Dipodomys ordii]